MGKTFKKDDLSYYLILAQTWMEIAKIEVDSVKKSNDLEQARDCLERIRYPKIIKTT